MKSGLKKRLFERARCTRHNLLHLKVFRLSYDGELWHVRDGNVDLRFPFYPWLTFYEIEGYLAQGRWRLEPGMNVVDAGGCFGEFALYAAKRVAPGRVLMLEPDQANIARAQEYFACNGGQPPNLEIIPLGLWNKRDTLRFSSGRDGASSIVDTDSRTPPAPGAEVEIKVCSLEDVVRDFGLTRLDFVKMDIEGAEMEAVAGAGEVMRRFKPRFSIAAYHLREKVMTSEMLPKVFESFGYRATTGFYFHRTTYAASEFAGLPI